MTMSSLLGVLILVGVISTIQGLLQYRCDVVGCGTGEYCNATSHECTCVSGDFGVPCATPVFCFGANTCVAANTITGTNKCQNVAGNSECICIEGYYGNLCQFQRVRATCVVGEPLKIYVAPYQNTGSIKVYYASDAATLNGDLSNYNCVQDTLTGDEYQRLDLPQNVDSAVGDCQPANVVDGKQVYHVYLQQVSPYRIAADQFFTVDCDPTDSEASVITAPNPDMSSPVSSTSSVAEGIVMKVRTEEIDNQLVDITQSAVTLGTRLAITIEHQGPIVVHTCTVSSGIAGQEEELITDLCIPFSAKSIFWGKVQVSNSSNVVANGGTAGNNMVKLRVRAFRFQDSGSLLFSCTVCKDQACTGGASTPTCNPDYGMTTDMIAVHADLPAASRRRRATSRRRRAVTGLETQTNLTVELTIVDEQ